MSKRKPNKRKVRKKWEPDWNAFIQYNMNDILFSQDLHDLFYESCRRELMPQFGSAWENMMHYYYHRPKEAQNA